MAIDARDMSSWTSFSMAAFRGVGIATSDMNGPSNRRSLRLKDGAYSPETKNPCTLAGTKRARHTAEPESLPRQAPFGITPTALPDHSYRDLRSLALQLSETNVSGFAHPANWGRSREAPPRTPPPT